MRAKDDFPRPLDGLTTCHLLDLPYESLEQYALFTRAHAEDVEHGGRYKARSAAIDLWSHPWTHPAMRTESTRLGAYHFRWGNYPGLWKIETHAGFALADLLVELGTLEEKGFGHLKHGYVRSPRTPVLYCPDPTATEQEVGRLCGETSLRMLLQPHNRYHSLVEICAITRPEPLGTAIEALVEAARQLDAARSFSTSLKGRRQAYTFLKKQAPFIAFVSPSTLYGEGDSEGGERWAHAVVVLYWAHKQVVYHDPDPIAGGPQQSRPVGAFLDAWQERFFRALVVRI